VDVLASIPRTPHLPIYNQGTFPIDAIYASTALLPGANGDYLKFKAGLLSDHWGLWLDLRKDVLWSSKENFSISGHAWHLKCEDPWVV